MIINKLKEFWKPKKSVKIIISGAVSYEFKRIYVNQKVNVNELSDYSALMKKYDVTNQVCDWIYGIYYNIDEIYVDDKLMTSIYSTIDEKQLKEIEAYLKSINVELIVEIQSFYYEEI